MTTYNEEFNQYRIFLENIAKSITPQDSEVLIKPQHLRNRVICHSDAEGEVIYWILKFLDDKKCPTKLVAPIVRNVLIEIQNDPRYKDPNTEAYFDLRGFATTILEGFCTRLLDNVELNKILDTATSHSAQQKLNDDLLSIPIRAVGASQNKRRKMEDRSICIDEFHKVYNVKDAQKASFYGVFDGHIGYLAAQYAASQLPFNFALDAFASTNPIAAFYRTFKYTDEKFISKGVPSGTTAVCALYRPEESRLYIAWVGDSKAMLAKQHGKIMQLVKPHRPEVEKERDRIHALGGSIHFVQDAYRVNGSLNLTRSIGDIVHKTFLISHPDCVVVEMDKQEEFLVIATDGLWDYVYETDVARVVYESITEDCENLDQIPSRLIKLAQDGNSTDNISVIVLFFKHPSQIAKNYDNLNIMESEFDNIKDVGYYNSKNFYPSEENSTSNSHAIDAKQLRWSPNDNLNNIINEEVKQTSTTTAGTTTSANNGQFDDNLLYSSDNIDTNQKNPPPVEDDNNSHYHTSTLGNLGEELLSSGLDNKMELTTTGFDNDQRKILEKNQLQQQLADTDADYGPETCVDVTDDVVMMTENSADTNNLLEQSTLSHSKDTLPSSDNCNPFDNKNTLDLEDANEFHLGGIGADAHLHLDDANKSTPLLSPEAEDLPLSSDGGLQYTNEGFQQSPLNEEIPVGIASHQRQNEFEDEFMQRNGHFSPTGIKTDELEKENVTQKVDEEQKQLIDNDIPGQDADIQQYLTESFSPIQQEQHLDSFENNDHDDGDFRSKDEEEILEKHAEPRLVEKELTDLDNDVLNLNQRSELQQTRQYLEDDIFEEKPILTGYLAENQFDESSLDEQTPEEKPTGFVEEKQNREEFTEKKIELEDECIHLEEDVRPSEYLAMLARQQEEQQNQLFKVDHEFVQELSVDEENAPSGIDEQKNVQEDFERQDTLEVETIQVEQELEIHAKFDEDAFDIKNTESEGEEQPLRKVDQGFVREYTLDEDESLPNGEEQNLLRKDDEGLGAEEITDDEQAQTEPEPQPLRKIDQEFVREDTVDEDEALLIDEQQDLRKIDEGFVIEDPIESEIDLIDTEPQPLRKVDEGYLIDNRLEEEQHPIEQLKENPVEKPEEFSVENVYREEILPQTDDEGDRLSDKVEQFSKEQERLNEKEEKELNEEETNLTEQLDLDEKQTEQTVELPKDANQQAEPEPEPSQPSLLDNIQQETDTNKLPTDGHISPLGDDATAQPEKQCFEEPEKKIDDATSVLQDIDDLVAQHDQNANDELPVEEHENKLDESVEATEKQLIEVTEKQLSKIEQQIQEFDAAPAVKKQVQPLLQAFDEDPDNLVEVVEELIVKEQVKPKPDVPPAAASQEPSAVPHTHESCDESEDEEWKYMKEGQGEKQLLGLQSDVVVEEESHPEEPESPQQPAATPITTTLSEQISSTVSDKVETVKDTFESLTLNIAELAESAGAAITDSTPAVEKIGDALENLNLSQSSTREQLDNLEDENLSASEMNSRLNPDAKEFVPSFSPTAAIDLSNGFNIELPTAIPHHFKDELLAQSPRKGRESNMENISLPAENEFDEEIANKPHGLPGDEAIIEHAENGLYQEMNWKEAMHGSEKEEGPLVDSPATEDSVGTGDNVPHYAGAPNLCGFSAPIDLDNAGMKDSIYLENNSKTQARNEEDVLNTVQVLPVEDVESKDNSFEMLNASRDEDITTSPTEKDAVTEEGVQQILTLASDANQTVEDEQIKQTFEQLLLSHDKEITKNVQIDTEQTPSVPTAKLLESSQDSVTEKPSDLAAEEHATAAVAAAGLGLGAVAAVAVAATTAATTTAATKKVEAEKNQKNLLKSSAATKPKVPDTKKPAATGSTAKTVSSVAAKRTVADKSKPSVSSSITKKPISSTIPAAARPRTAPAAASKTAASSAVKSRIDTKPPSTMTTRKPLASGIAKTTKADDGKLITATTGKPTTGSKTSIGKTTPATNSISKPRPTTASAAAATNGSTTKTAAAPKPISLAAKNAATTKSSLTSPRGTLTSTLRKTEALKSPTKTTSSTITSRASSSTNGTKTTTTTRTTTTKTTLSSTSTVPTAAARTTTTTRRTITGTSSTTGGATTPTSKTNHLVPRKSTPLKKTTTNSSSTTPIGRKNPNTSVSKTTKDTSTPKPIKGNAANQQNSIIIAEPPKDLLDEQVPPNATSTPPSDNGEPKLNGIASPDDVASPVAPTTAAPINHPLEAEVA